MYPGLIKQELADWQVTEVTNLKHSGGGEHAYFYVEKRGKNTLQLVQEAATAFDVARVDVGYAGRKDKQGITRQWLSVRTDATEWPEIPDTQCLEISRHDKKLRIGELAGNRFNITLREPSVDAATVVRLVGDGFPNAFGPQRVSDSNVEQATTWLLTQREKRSERRRRGSSRGRKPGAEGWHLSVLRSFLFNQILSLRLQAGDRALTLLEGDVLVDGFPSAPLWGRGRSSSQRDALAIENAALAPHLELSAALEHTGLQQARRALWSTPIDLSVQQKENALELTFGLRPGVYATSLLAHLGQLAEER